jgi:hypothetical protein
MAGQGHALARRLHDVLGEGRPGQVAGAMFAIPDPEGWYPALVLGARGMTRGVFHQAYGLDTGLLAALDDYEQVVESGAGYRRRDVPVVDLGLAQAYIWQGTLPEGALALEDGDFAAFLARTGQRAFGG